MSDESRMTPDLEKLESELRGVVLSASTNREEVLYQAGWAAALASLAQTTSNEATPTTASRSWGWPMTSAGLAVVAATLALLLVFQINKQDVAPDLAIANEIQEDPHPESEDDSDHHAKSSLAATENFAGLGVSWSDDWMSRKPLTSSLALHVTAEQMESTTEPIWASGDDEVESPKSHRRILDELLPDQNTDTKRARGLLFPRFQKSKSS